MIPITAGGWSTESDGMGGLKAKVDVPRSRTISYYCVKIGGTKTSGASTTNIDTFGWELGNCYGTIQAAITQMGRSDHCWVDNGTYTKDGTVVSIASSKSGEVGAFTVIRARNPGNVELATTASSGGSGIKISSGTSYVRIEGFHVSNVSLSGDRAAIYIMGCHHIFVKRCSWARSHALTSGNSHYVTYEDCFAYGGPLRYAFHNGTSGNDTTSQIVYRRCLVRWDYSNVSEPLGCFGSYTSDQIAYQNCISIDGTDNKGVDMASDDGLKSFFTPNGSTDVRYDGCIVACMTGAAGWWLEGKPVTGSLTNCIVWGNKTNYLMDGGDLIDSYGPRAFASTSDTGGGVTLRNCIFGANDIAYNDDGIGNSGTPIQFDGEISESMRNCIIYDMELEAGVYAVASGLADEDYNCFYGNTGGRNKDGALGAHSLTNVNPITQASSLLTAGDDGLRIGALIMTRIGTDGTFWGDPGWDIYTGISLWPWPYEDQIRERCASFYKTPLEAYSIAAGDDFDSPEMIGARGFCAPGQTLTRYLFANLPIGLRVPKPPKPPVIEPDFQIFPEREPVESYGRIVRAYNKYMCPWNFTGDWRDAISADEYYRTFLAGIKRLTGDSTAAAAWATLIPAYQASDKFVIKVNHNSVQVGATRANTTIQMASSVIHSLVDHLGVAQADITVYDSVRNGATQRAWRDALLAIWPNIGWKDRDTTVWDAANPVVFPNGLSGCFATHVVDADHIINLCLLKGHTGYCTGAMKNHFGTMSRYGADGHSAPDGNPDFMHNSRARQIAHLANLPTIKDKTRLVVVEAPMMAYPTDSAYFINCTDPWQAPNGRFDSLYMTADPFTADNVIADIINLYQLYLGVGVWTNDFLQMADEIYQLGTEDTSCTTRAALVGSTLITHGKELHYTGIDYDPFNAHPKFVPEFDPDFEVGT